MIKLIREKCILVILLNFLAALTFAKAILPNARQEGQQVSGNVFSLNDEPVSFNGVDISSNSTSLTYPLLLNLPPIANAGTDTTIVLPTDNVTLRGCASSDPEMAGLSFKWIKIAGPGAFLLPADNLCSVKVSGMVEGTYSFELTVTDIDGLTGKDTVVITVNSVYSSNWPPRYTPLCNQPFKIVVIGSSTAFGTGANPIDSSWVNKFALYLSQQNIQVSVINLAFPGFNSYHLSPTGIAVPSNWSFIVDSMRNITKALSLNPDAIIMNLPSNDVDLSIPFSEIQFNYNRIKAAADAQHVPIWVTTTQPRNMAVAQQLLQMNLRDWIMNRFGEKAVDFWSTISNPDGSIKPAFDRGDGIHPNTAGHHVLFTRIVEERIWDTICINKNAVLTYSFTGNGNWNVPSNWTNNLVPPAILSGNALIIIDPVINGECVLNTSQKLVNGAILKVMENKKFRISGSFELIK